MLSAAAPYISRWSRPRRYLRRAGHRYTLRSFHRQELKLAVSGFRLVVDAHDSQPAGFYRRGEHHTLRYGIVEDIAELAGGLNPFPGGAVGAYLGHIFEHRDIDLLKAHR